MTTRLLPPRHSVLCRRRTNSISYTFRVKGVFLSLTPCLFVLISNSADPTEKTFTLFGKIKGRTEVALRALPSTPSHGALRVFNVRPGFVDPSPLDKRENSLSKRILLSVAGPLLRLVPSQVSPADVLAKVLLDLATGDGNPLAPGTGIEDDGYRVRCIGVRKLGGL